MSQILQIHEKDLGTKFVVAVVDAITGLAIDLTGYDTVEIIFEDPNGVGVAKSATVDSPATDGKIFWISTADFLTPPGQWNLQARIVHSGNSTDHKSEQKSFKVHDNIAIP